MDRVSGEVAFHAREPDRVVAGSQFGLGQTIPTHDGHDATVTDIKSVWKDDKNVGWVYRDNHGEQYFQQNRAVDPISSWSVGLAKFVEIGQSSATGPGPVQELDAKKTVDEQLPPHTQVLQGFDSHLGRSPQDGRSDQNSPISVGDEIPNGKGGMTTISAVNSIENSGQNVGWAYQGADKHAYFQRRFDTQPQTNVGGGPAVFSVSTTTPPLSGVHTYQSGDLRPGDRIVKMDPNSPTVRLGFDSSSITRLREGGSLTGSIVAISEEQVIQNAGRSDCRSRPGRVTGGSRARCARHDRYEERRPSTRTSSANTRPRALARMIAAIVLAAAASSVLSTAKADAKTVGFKNADTCAYAPFLIGGGSPLSLRSSVIDIEEIDDPGGRVVGFQYVDDRGVRFVQATALMSLATVERLGFHFAPGDLVSDLRSYDGHAIGLTIRSCRPKHVMSNLVVKNLNRDMGAAIYSGLDVLPAAGRRQYIDRFGLSRFGGALPGPSAAPERMPNTARSPAALPRVSASTSP